MKNKLTLSAIALSLVLVGAGCAKSADDQNTTPVIPTPVVHDTSETKPVTYNPTGITPKEITIHVGDSIEFRNSDVKPHWPASAPHPSHSDYPEFDPKAAVKPGDVWRFKFTKKGDWKFHDHLNPTNTKFQGVVHVQ